MNKQLLKKIWPASWIKFSGAGQISYGVYFFRKSFYMQVKPKYFPVHVSADNCYRLFVNGVSVCSGPAHSDLLNWVYESVDLAPYMSTGHNTIACLVWNMGLYTQGGQISSQTAFLMQGDTENEEVIDTNQSWKVMQATAYRPCSINNAERLYVYMVAGPGDEVNGNDYPWGWENIDFDDSEWEKAAVIKKAIHKGLNNDQQWSLTPRTIPLLEEELLRFVSIRRLDGLERNVSVVFLRGYAPVFIPKNSMVSILIDQSYVTVCYPELILGGGKDATIMLTYAESLFDRAGNKGNRNEINGKFIKGNYDLFITDGGENRLYRPLGFRAYRYVQMDIWTKDEPLIIKDFYGIRTGYPSQLNASFSASDESLQEIWKVGYRTLQNCAGDCFYDTPYYEQLQYVGDSRIQALMMLYTSGDDRLMRKCIVDFYNSRIPEGLTQSRYPNKKFQVIPAFSLFWISMIYDYWMHRKDDVFVKQFLPAISDILNWFEERIDPEKEMLGPLTWWNFVDWDNFNEWGTAPGADDGNSTIISLHLAYTLNQAAELFEYFKEEKEYNKEHQASVYKDQAIALCKNTFLQCFDLKRGLIADTPEKNSYSQHANIWAILSGGLSDESSKQLMKTILYDESIAQVTYFYRFYLNQALKKVGMADLYYSLLTPWRNMLKLGLTTFAEKPEPTRSDCHGWSASPIYDFLATICGIMPGSPGFATVLIQPAPGELNEVSGRMPHPQGFISVSMTRKGKDGLVAEISLPKHLTGTFIWKNKRINLHGGKQQLIF